jgi:hypothetical protein
VDRILRTQTVEVFMRTLAEDRVERGKLKAGRQRLFVGHDNFLRVDSFSPAAKGCQKRIGETVLEARGDDDN